MQERWRSRAPEEEGRILVERLGGRWGPAGGMCLCPAHDDRTPSLSVRPGRDRLLLHCFAGCTAEAVLRALQSAGLLASGRAHPSGLANPCGNSRRLDAAARIWDEARRIEGTPAEAYLAARGLRAGSAALRFHARTPHGRGPCAEFRPALIAAVRDEGGLTGIHRTFIDPRTCTLAAVRTPKCGLGSFGAGAVRLGGIAPLLGLAEGIETALSASLLFGIPCWAALGTERFRRVALPAGVRQLRLFLDNDAGGRRAEALARQAFAHLDRVEACYPPGPGEDWNDVLRRRAAGEEWRRREDG